MSNKVETTEWGYLDGGPRKLTDTLWRRMKLFAGIVGRTWHAGRIGPVCAWRVVRGVHPWREPVKQWGIISR